MAAGRSGTTGSGRPDGWRPPIDHERAAPGGWAPAVDEGAIVDSVLRGDHEAFRRLVEREADGLVRACARVLGDHADAEDAAQEAFVTAYRSLASWRGEGPFGAWLTRIGIRIALRMASRRRTVTWRHPAGERPASGSASHVVTAAERAADRVADRDAVAASPLTDPALLSLRAERATELRAAVTALPEPYREVVALRFFADSSLDEIARQTGRPLGTVKTHLHRGLRRLRDTMDRGEQ